MDRELRYVRINDLLAAFNGKPAAEHLGRTPMEVIPEIAAATKGLRQEVLRTGTPVLNVEVHSTQPAEAGDDRHWLASYYPSRSATGEIEGVSVVVSEVTELKRVLAALDEARKTLLEGQRIAHLGSFEYRAATQTTIWSAEQFRIYGLDPAGPSPTPDELLTKAILPEDRAWVSETFNRAVQSRSVYDLEHRVMRPDGSVRWTHDRARPYFDERGELVRYVGTTLDITERKEAEQALRDLCAQMEGIQERERQRLGRELHDGLSQLLAGAKFQAGLLRRQLERDVPVDVAALRRLEGELDQALGQARDLARGMNPVNLIALGLVGALAELASSVGRMSGLDCTFESAAELRSADQEVALQLYRIAQESVQNAVQHGQARHVSIRLTQGQAEGCLEVRDDGVGFIPARPTAGMGLPNLRARAAAIGGRLEVQSQPGGGTTVTCRWPASDAPASPTSSAP